MKSANIKILIVALIMSVITTGLCYVYFTSLQEPQEEINYISVTVAAQTIPARTKISASMLKKIDIPADSPVLLYFKSSNQIIGKFSNETIYTGESIPKEKLIDELKIDLSLNIPEGKQAISILVDESTGVADQIVPGDFIDIYAFQPEKQLTTSDETIIFPNIVSLLTQRIHVLSIDKQKFRDENNGDREVPQKYTVTIAVTPNDAERIILSQRTGVIVVALRNLDDSTIYSTDSSIREDLVPDKGILHISNESEQDTQTTTD